VTTTAPSPGPRAGEADERTGHRGVARAAIVYNPISGAGRARAEAKRLAAAVEAAGHEAVRIATRLEPVEDWLEPELPGCDALAVVGGDGAVRMAAPSAARAGVPLHHHPLGTENLFARYWGTTREPGRFVSSLARVAREREGGGPGADSVATMDLWTANGAVFTIMASAGLDAEVVQDLASRRTGSISHLSYAMPIVRTALRWRAPRFRVFVDEKAEPAIDGFGVLVAANLKEYGGRLDPVPEAVPDDGVIDLVLLPARGALGVARSALACRLRRRDARAGVQRASGRSVRVEIDPSARLQVDGDPPRPPSVNAPATRIEIERVGESLRVLLPPGR